MSSTHPARIGLGSNIGDAAQSLVQAADRIRRIAGLKITAKSSLYRSEPWGNKDQPDFVNAVLSVTVVADPMELLTELLSIENDMGRQRGPERWGPRLIDLDLLMYGNQIIKRDELELPHPRMHLRRFVLVPLEEVTPGLEIPGRGAVRNHLQVVESQKLIRLGKFQ